MAFGIEVGADAFSRRTFLQSWHQAIVPQMTCAIPVSNYELVLLFFPYANGNVGSSFIVVFSLTPSIFRNKEGRDAIITSRNHAIQSLSRFDRL